MEENRGFVDWIKYRWKVISVSDGHFFRFIWITAVCISILSVVISAGVIVGAEKKEAKRIRQELQEKKKAEEEAAIASATEAEEKKQKAVDEANAWKTVLVNATHPLEASFTVPEFTELMNNQKVDKRMYPDLQDMFDTAREKGVNPLITESYISPEDADGENSCELEHATGLAIDIVSKDGDDAFDSMMEWFSENAAQYGFIIRYPEDKYSITGVKDAKGHLRYVGPENAAAMKESGQCLEEFLEAN